MPEQNIMTDRKFLMQMRQNWLGLVATVEKWLGIEPSTKEMVGWYKEQYAYDATHTSYPEYEHTSHPGHENGET